MRTGYHLCSLFLALCFAVCALGRPNVLTLTEPLERQGIVWPAGTGVTTNEKGELNRCRLGRELTTPSGYKLPAGTEVWGFADGQPATFSFPDKTEFCGVTLPPHSTVFLPVHHNWHGGWRLWPSESVVIQDVRCAKSDDGVGHFFYSDGRLRAAWIEGNQEIQGVPCTSGMTGMPLRLMFYGFDKMAWFYHNGKLRQALVSREVEIQGWKFTKGDIVAFDRSGMLDLSGLTQGWDGRGPIGPKALGVIPPGDKIPEASAQAAVAESAKLAAIKSALNARLAGESAASFVSSATTPPGLAAISEFKDAGQSSPSAAVETIIWAVHHGDVRRLTELVTFDPEGRRALHEFLGKLTHQTRELAGAPESLLTTLFAYRQPVGRYCHLLPSELMRNSNDRLIQCEIGLEDGERDWINYRLRLDGAQWKLVVGRREVIVLGRVLTQEGVLPPPTAD